MSSTLTSSKLNGRQTRLTEGGREGGPREGERDGDSSSMLTSNTVLPLFNIKRNVTTSTIQEAEP